MMEKVIRFNLTIEPGQQGSYFTVPFEVPQGIESLELTYEYPRRLKRKEEQPGEIFAALGIFRLWAEPCFGKEVGEIEDDG